MLGKSSPAYAFSSASVASGPGTLSASSRAVNSVGPNSSSNTRRTVAARS